MRKFNILYIGIIGASILGAGISYAGGETHEENTSALFATSKISLSQAIAAAESHVHGKAIHAALVNTQQGTSYAIEVIKGTQAMDVTVNPVNAKIISSHPDQPDVSDEEDETSDD